MSRTPTIDRLVNRAIEVCQRADVLLEAGSAEAMDAQNALIQVLSEQIQTDNQAFALLGELVDCFDAELRYDDASGDNFVDFVQSLVNFAPDHLFKDRIIEGVSGYSELVARRQAALEAGH